MSPGTASRRPSPSERRGRKDGRCSRVRDHHPSSSVQSFSALEELAKCPYRYFLHRLVGLAPAEEPKKARSCRPPSWGCSSTPSFGRKGKKLPKGKDGGSARAAAEAFDRFSRENPVGLPGLFLLQRGKSSRPLVPISPGRPGGRGPPAPASWRPWRNRSRFGATRNCRHSREGWTGRTWPSGELRDHRLQIPGREERKGPPFLAAERPRPPDPRVPPFRRDAFPRRARFPPLPQREYPDRHRGGRGMGRDRGYGAPSGWLR